MDSNEHTVSAVVLLIIGEPFSEDQKTLILDEITKGLRCWDVEDTGININEELAQIAGKASLGLEGTNGERLIQHQSDNLAVEILVNPFAQTVKNSVKKLLIAPAPTKYIIYAGHVFQGSGAWVLQDDTFAFSSLAQVFRNIDVENALKQNIEANLTIHTLADSNWGTSISKADFTNNLRIQLNPPEKLDSIHGVLQFIAYVGGFVQVVPITNLLQASEQFGNISFTRPTLYIFPGCQGDSALFGINGFNLLVNGGYNRRACFWDFARHLDRVDAMLMTHLGTDNIFGLKTVLQRKSLENIHPQIGYLFFNALEKPGLLPAEEEDGDYTKKSGLLINLAEEANKVTQMAKQLGISPHPCSRSASAASCEPVNLYHKLGHGSLDMYILNPVADSKELKDFYQLWSKQAANLGTTGPFPLQNALSVCALLVWKPYNIDEKIVRILFPGNAPQQKVIEGFEKMKCFDFLKYASCALRDLTKPTPVKKTAVGSNKSSTGGRGPVKASRSEARKILNTARVESPRKETKTIPAKPEGKSTSPTKPVKSFKEESSRKNSKISEKPKVDDKETKLKSVPKVDEKDTTIKKNARPISVPSPVRGPSTPSKNSSPTKSTSSTKSIQESASVSSPIKTQESKSVVAAAPADHTEIDASAVSHVDQHDLKLEAEQDQPTEKDILESFQALDNTISEARDAVGAIDDMSVSFSSALDKQKLQDLGIYDEEHGENYTDGRNKYEFEDEEKPQALPEPTIIVESPSQESDGLPEHVSKIQADQQDLSEINDTKGKYKLEESNICGDPAEQIPPSPEPSFDEQQNYHYPSSVELPSEFETPIFCNEGPDITSIQPPVEQSIQYGIDNSSNGRDMGGIQEVDEEEHEDYVTKDDDNHKENSLDRDALREMGIYDDDENDVEEDGLDRFVRKSSHGDDDEVKEGHKEEMRPASHCKTSAEGHSEDVGDESSQQAEDDDSSSLPAAFDKDSSPEVDAGMKQVDEPVDEHEFNEREDRDSIDGGAPEYDQNVDEDASFRVNGDVSQTAEEDSLTGIKSAGDASANLFSDVEGSEVRGQTHKQDFGDESDDEPAASFDPVTQWGHPMGLPSPPPTDKKSCVEGKKGTASPNGAEKHPGTARASKASSGDTKSDGKKRQLTSTAAPGKGTVRQGSASNRPSSSSARSSPLNTKTPSLPPMIPFYVDLTYVPNHADSLYSDVEFFKRIRARYYVISALSPNPQVLDSLLEAKTTWEQKDLEVTIIPTYDNETLRHWMGLNAEKLQELRIDLKPAVNRCTIQLQDLETSLPAYRLEV